MKVYVLTDIEGVAGWVYYAHNNYTPMNTAHTLRMNRLLTNEVAAACTAAVDEGAQEVVVLDAHGPGYSIFVEDLPDVCEVIHGRMAFGNCFYEDLDDSFDALIAIGAHAMAATPKSVCPHSCWHLRGKVKGQDKTLALSETTMFAAIGGQLGVPLVCVSGDDKIADEVRSKIPGCETAVVKQGMAPEKARTRTPRAACEMIRAAVRRGLRQRAAIEPYVVEGPYQLNLSDRDPNVRMLPEDLVGEDLPALMKQFQNQVGAHFDENPIDDRAFRWPK